jgi:hypothetical protein
VSPEELDAALSTLTELLRTNWTTGGGRRLRYFVWSLWNGWHLVNLFDLSHGLDGTLIDQLLLCFGPLWSVRLQRISYAVSLRNPEKCNAGKRRIVKRQKGLKSSIPLPPLDADALKPLVESATRLEQLDNASSR